MAALQLGLDLGMWLIDTAEMYADGGSEKVVGEAIKGRREEVFVVTKVRPSKASRTGTIESAEASLGHLGTDRIDLLLLHDVPRHPLEDTLEAFETLRQDGKIRFYGVSNFNIPELEAMEASELGRGVVTNQLRYAVTNRGLEHEIQPWSEKHDVSIMAYSPVGQGRLDQRPALEAVARRHGVSPHTVAIAWTMRHPMFLTVPKSSNPNHVRDNAKAMDITFTDEDLAELDAGYPRPAPGHFDIYEGDGGDM